MAKNSLKTASILDLNELFYTWLREGGVYREETTLVTGDDTGIHIKMVVHVCQPLNLLWVSG